MLGENCAVFGCGSVLSKNERNWYMQEVAIGEGRSPFNMEKGMAWRDQEDEGFKSSTYSLTMIYIKYTIPYNTASYAD